jgi:hypothetical protein
MAKRWCEVFSINNFQRQSCAGRRAMKHFPKSMDNWTFYSLHPSIDTNCAHYKPLCQSWCIDLDIRYCRKRYDWVNDVALRTHDLGTLRYTCPTAIGVTLVWIIAITTVRCEVGLLLTFTPIWITTYNTVLRNIRQSIESCCLRMMMNDDSFSLPTLYNCEDVSVVFSLYSAAHNSSIFWRFSSLNDSL